MGGSSVPDRPAKRVVPIIHTQTKLQDSKNPGLWAMRTARNAGRSEVGGERTCFEPWGGMAGFLRETASCKEIVAFDALADSPSGLGWN